MKRIIKKVLTAVFTFLAKRQVKSFGTGFKVNFYCKFTKKTVIKNNCHFNGMHVYGDGNVIFGDNFHSGKECIIMTSFHNYDGGNSIPYDNTYIDKDVIVDDNVWLGSRVMILSGVHIAEGAIIQAGSVVVSDIPYCGIAGGHPAKVFKYRDISHYEKLKQDKKFY
jgi:chloramphenicol O-acetyltransferase type B